MPKKAVNIKPRTDQGEEHRGLGLALYPNISADVPKLSSERRQEIIRLLQDHEFISNHKRSFWSFLSEHLFDRHGGNFARASWNYIKLQVNGAKPPAHLGNLSIAFTDLDRIIIHEPWVVETFIKDVCRLPEEFSSTLRDHFEDTFQKLVMRSAWLSSECERPIPYELIFGYLEKTSSLTEWAKVKYTLKSYRKIAKLLE